VDIRTQVENDGKTLKTKFFFFETFFVFVFWLWSIFFLNIKNLTNADMITNVYCTYIIYVLAVQSKVSAKFELP